LKIDFGADLFVGWWILAGFSGERFGWTSTKTPKHTSKDILLKSPVKQMNSKSASKQILFQSETIDQRKTNLRIIEELSFQSRIILLQVQSYFSLFDFFSSFLEKLIDFSHS
jgi:hypothetical protein